MILKGQVLTEYHIKVGFPTLRLSSYILMANVPKVLHFCIQGHIHKVKVTLYNFTIKLISAQ